MSLLIHNGIVITEEGSSISDIRIKKGKIIAISSHLKPADSERVIDASGKLVFPGGIDPHVHMQLKVAGTHSSDNFRSGSIAALIGGTTTLIDFVTPEKGESLVEALKERDIEARCAFTDYAFHVSPIEWREELEAEIIECRRRGVYSFKLYMAYKQSVGLDDDDLGRVLGIIGRNGGMAAVHCETGDEIDTLRDKLFDQGLTGPDAHPQSRPPYTEWKAVEKVIEMASGIDCPLYLVHISAKESVDLIKEAILAGNKVNAETCPQYLILDDSLYHGDFNKSSAYVMSPPLRKKADNESLWQAVGSGVIKTIGTDHCPFSSQQKEMGSDDFRKIPGGAGGVEHRMALMFTHGVLDRAIDIRRFVDLTSTNAAKIFGLYPRKGVIAVGSDADLVIWNPRTEGTISSETDHQASDINIYDGLPIMGTPQYVIKSGVVVVKNGKLSRELCPGQYLPSNK